MEITKVLKAFIRRGANTFGNIVYIIIISFTLELRTAMFLDVHNTKLIEIEKTYVCDTMT